MNFHTAQEKYRALAGKSFRAPDLSRSYQDGDTWRLRDCHGRPVAIVAADGSVFGTGIPLIITNHYQG